MQGRALEPLVTLPEAARLLRRRERTVLAYVARGDLAFVRVGHDMLFEPTELQQFVERRRNIPAAKKDAGPAATGPNVGTTGVGGGARAG